MIKVVEKSWNYVFSFPYEPCQTLIKHFVADSSEADESWRPGKGPPAQEPPHSVGQMPPGLGIQPPNQGTVKPV